MIKEVLFFLLWGVIAPVGVYFLLALLAWVVSPAAWSVFDCLASVGILVVVTVAIVNLIRLRVGGAHA